MGLDDPFDDVLADNVAKNNTRGGGKFQPKSKRGPTKKPANAAKNAANVADVPPSNAGNVAPSASSQHVETGDSAQNKYGVALQAERPSETLSASPGSGFQVGDSHSCLEKPVGETADVFPRLEPVQDILSHSSPVLENLDPLETRAVRASQNVDDGLASPIVSRVTDSGYVSDVADDPTSQKVSPARDLLADGQSIISVDGRQHDMHSGRLENEQIGSYSDVENLDISDLTATSGPRARKFQPKPKMQIRKERTEASKPDKMENVMCQMNSDVDPSEMQYNEEIISAVAPDDVLDFSYIGLDHSNPTEPTCEPPADERPEDLAEVSQEDASTHEEHIEAVPVIREKIATKRAKARNNRNLPSPDLLPNQESVPTSSHDNEAGKVLRTRRKRRDGRQLVDEPEVENPNEGLSVDNPSGSVLSEGNNEDLQVENEPEVKKRRKKSKKAVGENEPNGELSADYPGRSIVSEGNNEDLQVENESEGKKRRKKSNKAVGEKEKPARKRKKAGEEPDQETPVKPKKFSHSTTRKRRIVNKVLLETPEDEIDFQKVPLRELIILADYKERAAKKEAAEAARLGAPLNDQGAGTASMHHNENEGFPTELGDEADDGQESPRIQEGSGYVNYQTYMNKTPSSRWSKQDTVLFYKAVQQFGTDLSMIQQLFPDRTRRQIRSKFKKEESQHPFRLRDALTNRTNDHSFFQQVIEHLRQAAAEDSNREESINLADDGEEVEQVPKTNEEAAKSEPQTEQGTKVESVPDVPVQSPPQDDQSEEEDDQFDWSVYKSEV